MKAATRKYVKHKDVVDYWSSRIDECDLGVDWADDAEHICWRCGCCKRSLERCHIVPRAIGGSDEVSNIILLCKDCHVEAPDCSDEKEIWLWIKQDHGSRYEEFWLMKTLKELFRRHPDLDPSKFSIATFKSLLSTAVNPHCGSLSTSTLVWAASKSFVGEVKL